MKTTIRWLLALALVLPIALCIISGLAQLLRQMGDTQLALFLHRSCLVGGALWSISLVCLLIALAIELVGAPGSSKEGDTDRSHS